METYYGSEIFLTLVVTKLFDFGQRVRPTRLPLSPPADIL
jgi:hypothetical protein